VFGYVTVRLEDIVTIKRGIRVVKQQLSEIGAYPVYQNSMVPLGYYDKSNCPKESTFVICAGAAGEIGYSKTDFWAADDCFYFENNDSVNSRYIYYALMKQKYYIKTRVRTASVPRLSRSVIDKLQIQLPPMEEQQRIVNILDRFDKLCNDISEGLPAEIDARKKQYEYYRDKLLTFNEK
jgi:type I restriction enzyme S subunit